MAVGDPIGGEKRIHGKYGEVYRDGVFQTDVTEVSGTIDIDQIDVPMAGTSATGKKRGGVNRSGTLRFSQVDSRWHKEMFSFTSLSLAERRAARDAGAEVGTPFNLLVMLDDPEAFGAESMMLYGVQMWNIPIGFSLGDLVDREITITWEREELVQEIVQPA